MEMILNRPVLEAARLYSAAPRLIARSKKAPVACRSPGLSRDAGTDHRREIGGIAPADLTPRQLQVLALLAKGEPNKVIARGLGIAEGTVKIHLTAIFKALRVQNRSQAAVATLAVAVRPKIALGPTMPDGVQVWRKRHPFDHTGRVLAASMGLPGTVQE